VGLYFRLEARNRACDPFTSVDFTENQTYHDLGKSPWDWKICPKLLEINPNLVKITLRVRRSRLLFKSYDEVVLYFGQEARNQESDRFTSVHLTEYQDH